MANKVTIDTSALSFSWAINTNYRIAVDEGFVAQPSGERRGNAANASLSTFSTPATVPVVQTLDPANGTVLSPVNTAVVREITFTFDRPEILVGTGNFYLYKTAGAVLVQTYDVTSAVVIQNNNEAVIDITDLLEAGEDYYVLADAGTIKDYDDFEFAGITSNTEVTFTAPSAPALQSTVPADNSTAITENETFSFTMDRLGLTIETGNIYLYNTAGPTLVHTFDVTTDLTYNGADTFTFDITDLLLPTTGYYFTSDQGIITDNDELLSSAWNVSEWNFSTSTNFSVNLSNTFSSTEYAEDTLSQILNAPDIISSSEVATFTLAIQASTPADVEEMSSTGSGGTSTWNNTTKTLTIAGTKSQINSHLDALYLRPYQDLDTTISLVYTATRDSDSVQSTKTQSVTCTTTNAEVVNMIGYDRYYYRNSESPLFSYNTDTPYIDDEGVESTVSYTVTFNSADGQFGIPADTVAYQDTLTITGNKAYINQQIYKVWFKADDIAYDTTFTYTQTRSGIQQVNTTVDLLYGGIGFVVRTYDTAGTHSLTLDSTETSNNVFDILLVGGGAGGGTGGGGGGTVRTWTGLIATNGNYTITVGDGGEGFSATANGASPASAGACIFGDPDGEGPYGPCVISSVTVPKYEVLNGGGSNGGQSKIVYDDLGSSGIEKESEGGRAGNFGFDINSYTIGGTTYWRYSLTFDGGRYITPGGGTTLYEGGTLDLDWTTGEDDDFATEAAASEHIFDTYLNASTPMNSLASGGGAGAGGAGFDGNDATASNRGKGGAGTIPNVTVDIVYYSGGGGGINGYGQNGGGNGYNADGAGSAATAGTDATGGGGGAGFYDKNGTFYPGAKGGSGRVVIISRPSN